MLINSIVDLKGEVRVQNNLGWYERSYNAYLSHKVPHVQSDKCAKIYI
jgi:hypothetical protein